MEVTSVAFGILSAEEILKMGVCEVKEVSKNRFAGENTVYDERMGPIDGNSACKTCKARSVIDCPGHFGYIKLNYPILHPLHYKLIFNILKCTCFKCYKVIVTKQILDMEGISNDLNDIVEYVEKNRICYWCNCIHPKLVMLQDNIIYAIMTTEDSSKLEIHEEEIRIILQNMSDSDATLLGFDITKIHPKNLVITVLPVIPTCNRPSIQTDNIIADDDLTIQYIEIVKANKHLANCNDDKSDKKSKYIKSLKFRIKTLFDNSQGRARRCNNNRCYQGIKERLSSKTGLMRGHLNGKRVNFSGRTVIGPDPLIPITHVIIPEDMAKKLTIPVRVNKLNMDFINKLVDENKVNHVFRDSRRYDMNYAMYTQGTKILNDDIIIRDGIMHNGSEIIRLMPGDKIIRNGQELRSIEYPVKKAFNFQLGDIAERQMMDNDILLLNRQPT